MGDLFLDVERASVLLAVGAGGSPPTSLMERLGDFLGCPPEGTSCT